MKCVLCGAILPAPTGLTNTRYVDLDAIRYGACAAHFPPDGSTSAAFELVYSVFFRAALLEHRARWLECPGIATGGP